MSAISSPNWASATVFKRSDKHENVAYWVRRPEIFRSDSSPAKLCDEVTVNDLSTEEDKTIVWLPTLLTCNNRWQMEARMPVCSGRKCVNKDFLMATRSSIHG